MTIHYDLTEKIIATKKLARPSVNSRFEISMHDRITIAGKHMRSVGQAADGYILIPTSGSGISEFFGYEQLSRLNAAGEIDHQRDHFLPQSERSQNADSSISLFDLTKKQQERFWNRYSLVCAYLEFEKEGRVAPNDKSISKRMAEICQLAATIASKEMPTPEDCMRDEEIRSGQRRRRQGGSRIVGSVEPVHATTLRKWVTAYRRIGKLGLIDSVHNRGNRYSFFTSEEQELLHAETRKSYFDINRPTQKKTTGDVQRAFEEINELRSEQGLTPFRIPSRDAVRRCIKSYSKFEILLHRYGFHEAMKRCKPVGRGIETSRPLERCEMDEWRVDLRTLISGTGLVNLFSQEELEDLGLLGEGGAKSMRWWLSVIIDCRTRCIIAMKLTKNPQAATAIDCLQMAVQDKGTWADAVGAEATWDMFGLPEVLVTDNGAAFKSHQFIRTCLDLGITIEKTIAGVPSMRGAVERFFKTASTGLAARLHGRTFSSAVERGDHPTEERTCLNTEDLCFALVRWIVDVYHNTPHEGLHGRTPLQQWNKDIEDGNFPAQATPDMRKRRLVFGTRFDRTLSKSGVTVLGVQYHSEKLAEWFAHRGRQTLQVSWLPENIGSVFVKLGELWHEVPAVYEEFEGVHAQQWVAARRQMKVADPRLKTWEHGVVANALESIDAMNLRKSLEFGLVSQVYSEKRMEALEKELFVGFALSSSEPRLDQQPVQFGISVVPKKPGYLAADEGNRDRQPSIEKDVWESDEEGDK
jgi:putative transposase